MSQESLETEYGTRGYQAPEMKAKIYLGEPYDNSKVDVFALGLVLIRIHTGYQPIFGPDNFILEEVYEHLKSQIPAFWERVESSPTEP